MQKKELAHLTGLRAVAALTVLIAHAADGAFSYNGVRVLHDNLVYLAYFGMSIFFVLSGFVIYYNYARTFQSGSWVLNAYEFAVARFARLFPLYALVVVFFLDYLPPTPFLHAPEFVISYLTLTQSWFNLQYVAFPPAWSISTECFFYLFFALCMLLPSQRQSFLQIKRNAVIVYIMAMFLLLFVFHHQQAVLGIIEPYFKQPSNPDLKLWLLYYCPYVRIFEFIMGMYAAKLYLATEGEVTSEHAERKASLVSVMAVLVMLGLVAGNMLQFFSSESSVSLLAMNFAYAPFLAYILYAASRYNIFVTRLCSKRWIVSVGAISYSIYLMHAFSYVPGFISASISSLAIINSAFKMIVMTGMTIVIAYGSYHCIEMPCREWLRKHLSIRKKRHAGR